MADDGPSSPKKVRLDVDPDAPSTSSAIDSVDVSTNLASNVPETAEGRTSDLLFAARLRSHIRRQPKTDVQAACRSPIAWSSTNTIAVVRLTRITLVHVLAPSRVAHIPTPSKATSISFSPRGDALLACFPENLVLLWTAVKGTLNDWSLRGEWRQIEGRILDVQWLGSQRRWSAKATKRRTSARGPSVVDEPYGLAAFLVSDTGQLTVVQGDVRTAMGPFRVTQLKLPLAPYLRLQHSAINFISDEPLAVIAYTTRLSSKANVSDVAGAGHALGMFFDDGETTDDVNDVAPPSDGQDKIDLAEIRFFLDKDDEIESALDSRPLLPIYTASFANQYTPYAKCMTQMFWLDDVESDGKDEGAAMQLFASFYDESMTTTRLWSMKREDTSKLSEAFSKLESAKDVKANEDEEDWVAQELNDATFSEQILSDFVRCPSGPVGSTYLVCCVSSSTSATTLHDVPPLSLTYDMFDVNSLSLLARQQTANVSKTLVNSFCRLAVSPHGCLAAGIDQGKIVIIPLHDCDADVLRSALLQNDDISDLVQNRSLDINAIGKRIDLGTQATMAQTLPLIRLQAQQTRDTQIRRASLLLLELTSSFRVIAMSEQDNGTGFKFAGIWTMASQLEWTLLLLTMVARQAFMLDQQMQDASQETEASIKPSAYAAKDEPDLLSVFVHAVPRTLLTRNIMKLIAFCNWLDLIVEGGGGEYKGAYKVYSIRSTHNAQLEEKALSGTKIANSLALCHSKVRELLLQNAMDLSQCGRFLKSFNEQDAAISGQSEGNGLWYAGSTASNELRKTFVHSLLASKSIRTMLYLFCPPSEWTMPVLGQGELDAEAESEEEGTGAIITPRAQKRDALSKAPMTVSSVKGDRSSERRVCLTCKAETQLSVEERARCVCGARTWWSTTH